MLKSEAAPKSDKKSKNKPTETVPEAPTETAEATPDETPTPFLSMAQNYWGVGVDEKAARKAMLKAGASAKEKAIILQLPEGAHGAHVQGNGEVLWYGPNGDMAKIAEYIGGKRKAVEAEPAVKSDPEPEVQAEVAEPTTDKPKAKKAKPAKATPEPAANENAEAAMPATVETTAEPEPQDYLLFIGGNYYTKESFIEEAATLGISRRMPSHRLPKGLICGKSRVFVAVGGKRVSAEEATTSEVFGYFIPQAVEFIRGEGKNDKMYADVISDLALRPDSRIIGSIKGEAVRGCGTRKVGGTYIVVDKAESPLVLLKKPATYEGNHFRGLMGLEVSEATAFASGDKVSSLIDEVCMKCGAAMKCAPDGHARAERERRRIEKGEAPKWMLLDTKCRREKLQEQIAARRAAESTGEGVTVDASEEGSTDDMEAEGATLGTN